jgi:curved DNA-binding protein
LGQDFNAEFHLDLKEVYKRTLTVNIRLTIPAGVENGQVIKIQDMVLQDRRRSKGDLYITFTIDNLLKRDKENLYASVDLDLYKAILGGDITIDTFDGKVKLNVPAGTQMEQK